MHCTALPKTRRGEQVWARELQCTLQQKKGGGGGMQSSFEKHIATHCNSLQLNRCGKTSETWRWNSTHCNLLQLTAMHCNIWTHCDTLQLTATHCNSLQHTSYEENAGLGDGTRCNSLQHAATHCNTLQHTATHYNTPGTRKKSDLEMELDHCCLPDREYQFEVVCFRVF